MQSQNFSEKLQTMQIIAHVMSQAFDVYQSSIPTMYYEMFSLNSTTKLS